MYFLQNATQEQTSSVMIYFYFIQYVHMKVYI